MTQCRYYKLDNQPCTRRAIGGFGGCYQHDPEFEQERKRNARKGGKRGGRGRTPSAGTLDLQRLQKSFEELAERVLKDEVDRGTAAVVTQIWNGARSCVVASARMRELEEIEERLRALEEDLPSGLS